MKVISKKSTKKLVKNATYKVASFTNDNTRKSPYFRPSVRIYLTDNMVQTFPLECFSSEDGNDFPEINWICPEYTQVLNELDQMKVDNRLKSGDYVIPKFDNLKTLIKGRKYKVSEVMIGKHQWGGIKIKLDGSQRWYTSWNFRKCTDQEVRELNLKKIFDEQVDTERVGRLKRKIEYLTDEEKNELLSRILFQSFLDRNRNNSDIIEWSISKIGTSYNLNPEDFSSVLDLKLSDLMKIIK